MESIGSLPFSAIEDAANLAKNLERALRELTPERAEELEWELAEARRGLLPEQAEELDNILREKTDEEDE
jgi:hypothetical protein